MDGLPATSIDSISQRYGRTVGWTVLARLVNMVAGVLLVSLVSRELGADSYGVYAFLFTLFTTVSLLGGWGIGQASLRYVPELHLQGRAALVHYLRNTFALLLLGVGLVLLLGWLGTPFFKPQHRAHVLLVCGVGGLAVFKEGLWSFYMAHFRTRLLAITSVVNGVTTLGLAWWLLQGEAVVERVFLAQGLALAAALAILAIGVPALLRESPPGGEGHRIAPLRLFRYCYAQQTSQVINLLRDMHSEVYLLGFLATDAETGYFQMGYWLPFMALSMIPISIRDLAVSSFTQIRLRDPALLSEAMRWYYKLLITLMVPPAMLGFVFADELTVLLMGPEQAPAGRLASIFSLLLAIPLVYQPISLSLLALERAHEVLWVGAVELAVKLLVAWLLIAQFGLTGAVLAFPLTLALTLPLSLGVYRRKLGTLAFPGRYLLRTVAACSGVLLFLPLQGRLEAWSTLLPAILGALFALAVGVRATRLLGPAELQMLERARVPGRDLVLRWLAAGGAGARGAGPRR